MGTIDNKFPKINKICININSLEAQNIQTLICLIMISKKICTQIMCILILFLQLFHSHLPQKEKDDLNFKLKEEILNVSFEIKLT